MKTIKSIVTNFLTDKLVQGYCCTIEQGEQMAIELYNSAIYYSTSTEHPNFRMDDGIMIACKLSKTTVKELNNHIYQHTLQKDYYDVQRNIKSDKTCSSGTIKSRC